MRTTPAAHAAAAPARHPPAAARSATRIAAASCRRVVAGQADRIHHHVFFLGPLHHVFQRVVGAAEIHRCVDTVGEDENDPPALLMQQRRDADVDRIPQRRRAFGLELRPENLHQFVVVGGEVPRVELDAIGEAADARLIRRKHRVDKLLRRLLHEIEIRAHAAAAVEQHHDRNRLDVIGEQRQFLPLAIVVNAERRPLEVRNQPAGRVGHRRIHGDRAVGGGKGRRRLLSNAVSGNASPAPCRWSFATGCKRQRDNDNGEAMPG